MRTYRDLPQFRFSLSGIIALTLICAASLAFAAQGDDTQTIDTFTLAMKLFGGLSLFLFGIDQI